MQSDDGSGRDGASWKDGSEEEEETTSDEEFFNGESDHDADEEDYSSEDDESGVFGASGLINKEELAALSDVESEADENNDVKVTRALKVKPRGPDNIGRKVCKEDGTIGDVVEYIARGDRFVIEWAQSQEEEETELEESPRVKGKSRRKEKKSRRGSTSRTATVSRSDLQRAIVAFSMHERNSASAAAPDLESTDDLRKSIDHIGEFDEGNIILGKRRRKPVDYRKLNDSMFGDLSPSTSRKVFGEGKKSESWSDVEGDDRDSDSYGDSDSDSD